MKSQTPLKTLLCMVLILAMTASTAFAAAPYSKEETVYVLANSKGVIEKQVVSVHLHGDGNALELEDYSILEGIENIKSDDVPTIDGTAIHWKSDAPDIFYQGKTDKELPFAVSVSYTLDGTPVAPKDIIGKSGHLHIHLAFDNRAHHEASVDGRVQTLYTPLVIAGGINLPIDHFKNVTVSQGKSVSDGTNQLVSFVTLPGISENFKLKTPALQKELKALDAPVDIEADVTAFEPQSMMITVTPQMPNIDGMEGFNKIEAFTQSMERLKDNLPSMKSGTQKLSDGQKTFASSLNTYTDAVSQLGDGASKLNGGLQKLNEKATQLSTSSGQLEEGSKAFVEGVQAFASGAGQYAEGAKDYGAAAAAFSAGAQRIADVATGLVDKLQAIAKGQSEVHTGISGLSDGLTKANAGLKKITEGLQNASASTNADNTALSLSETVAKAKKDLTTLRTKKQTEIAALSALSEGNSKTITALKGLSLDAAQSAQVNALIAQIEKQREATDRLLSGEQEALVAIDTYGAVVDRLAQAQHASQAELLASLKDLNTAYEALASGAERLKVVTGALSEGTGALAAGTAQMGDAKAKLVSGAQGLTQGALKLSESSEALHSGAVGMTSKVTAYTEGMSAFTAGVQALSTQGIAPLAAGMKTLTEKMNTLKGANPKLLEGQQALVEGTDTLNQRVHSALSGKKDAELKEMENLASDVDAVRAVKAELEALVESASAFSGKLEGANQSVQYIYKIVD